MLLLLDAVDWRTIHPLEAVGFGRALLSKPQAPATSVAHNNDFLTKLVAPLEPQYFWDDGRTVVDCCIPASQSWNWGVHPTVYFGVKAWCR